MLTVSLFASVCVSFTWRDNWLENVVNELCATFWLAVRWGSVHSPHLPSFPLFHFPTLPPSFPPFRLPPVVVLQTKVNKCHRCQMMDVKVAFGNTWHTFPRASPKEIPRSNGKAKEQGTGAEKRSGDSWDSNSGGLTMPFCHTVIEHSENNSNCEQKKNRKNTEKKLVSAEKL